ncbi:MAG: D-alanyl-D-alanine carboxypeptidase/D-alanyl-D-alanine-endopeptidase [Streptomycetaceae bacterium]|nr:D-alanyl-D-alanine carboxypeptidase/D-alanyl-D-alanine-endopeptidase [Streptomycetaceae bacterium]
MRALSKWADLARSQVVAAKSYVSDLSGPLFATPLSAPLSGPARSTLKLVAGSAGAGLLTAGVATAVTGPWQSGQRVAERSWAAARDGVNRAIAAEYRIAPVPSAPAVLTGIDAAGVTTANGLGSPEKPLPTSQGLNAALGPLFNAPALGGIRTGAVLDAATGRELFDHQADLPTAPASTTKIATAVAALETLGPDFTIPTTVVPGPGPGTIVLAGGGDPTLTAAAPSPEAGPSAHPASLAALADATAKALRVHGTTKVKLAYDTSRYTGPEVHPIGRNDNIAPVTALMTDEGRVDPNSTESAPRVADPAASAAQSFAGMLQARGITVSGTPAPATAPVPFRSSGPSGTTIAQIRSMPLSALVERMLTNSDNDIAEALARQTAIGAHQPADFPGGATAVSRALAKLGLPLGGTVFLDGSGLAREDRLTAGLLARLLATAASPAHPKLRSVLSGLPIAGFTGTLSDRFNASDNSDHDGASAAGLVHAKTGTLTGVNTLAGTVVDANGRLLVFAFMTSGTSDPNAAVATLDRLATVVTGCGCR